MNRRDWIKTLGSAAVLKGLEAPARVLGRTSAPQAAYSSSTTRLETEIVRLNLRHTWTTTMSSSAYRDTLHVRYIRDGVTGHGEGAPIVRYKENAADAEKAVESVRDLVIGGLADC